MEKKLTCFVIIGYGKKTSYANGKLRVLDLDETYKLLIKPVFDALNITCYRAIDKNISGSIDKMMLNEIRHADIALVDLSTLNANVMWELGVRHALKPHHTIMICEKAQMNELPFDINHFPVNEYTHSEEGIPYREVDRFRTHLTSIIKGVLENKPHITDSPVYTFLKESEIPKTVDIKLSKENPNDSFAVIMGKAEEAKNTKDYNRALELLEAAKKHALSNMAFKDNLPLIISRQALCTYKSKSPNEQDALLNAKNILSELKPHQSHDIEVLGLSGAIEKRLYEITQDIIYLDSSILFYEKGFQLKQDYYNGINTAFMLYLKTSLAKKQGHEWEDLKIKADYIRNCVLGIALKLESDDKFFESSDAIWVLFTIAEAYNYKEHHSKVKEYEEKASTLAKKLMDTFALSSYQDQKGKISKILKNIIQ